MEKKTTVEFEPIRLNVMPKAKDELEGKLTPKPKPDAVLDNGTIVIRHSHPLFLDWLQELRQYQKSVGKWSAYSEEEYVKYLEIAVKQLKELING